MFDYPEIAEKILEVSQSARKDKASLKKLSNSVSHVNGTLELDKSKVQESKNMSYARPSFTVGAPNKR